MPVSTVGQRDKLVTIQQRTDAKATSGFPLGTWTTLSTAWMFKRDASGDESLRAAQVQASIDTEWELDYRANMDPDLVDVPKFRRLLYEGRFYDIKRAVLQAFEDGQVIRLFTLASAKQS